MSGRNEIDGRATHALRQDAGICQVILVNPAHAVRDPKLTQKNGKTHPHFIHTGGDWSFPAAA